MARVRLVHWKAEEIEERAERLRACGFRVDADALDGPGVLRAVRDDPPDALVVDLGRLPSHGREVGNVLRRTAATRSIPLVYVGGAPEKTERVRALLPDATYTTWERIGPDLERAIARPPAKPVVPASVMAGDSGTPLPRKLGIRPGATVALLDAPEGFEATLGELPQDVTLRRDLRSAADPILLFVRTRRDLRKGLVRVERKVNGGKLWIAWRKKSSGVATDVSEREVRAAGLDRGLVDFKICAVDVTWSGLLFARRR